MADIKVLGALGGDCDDDGDDGDGDERGKRGHRGHRGHEGATGPTGPAGTAINLLKFSGLADVAGEILVVTTYLADTGVFAGSAALTVAPSYPASIPFEVGSFATNVFSALTIPGGGFVRFELVKNAEQLGEVIVATITYNPGDTGGIKTTTFAPVSFAIGDTIDVRVVTSPGVAIGTTITVSAMVGS